MLARPLTAVIPTIVLAAAAACGGADTREPDAIATHTIVASELSTAPTIVYLERQGLFTIRADGSGRRQIVDAGGVAPAWSPDGRQIAYAEPDGGLLVIVAADGTGRRQLELGNRFVDEPSWSPDGRKIVCKADWYAPVPGSDIDGMQAMESRSDLFTVDVGSGRVVRLTSTPAIAESGPAWSPDGRRIAFGTALADDESVVGPITTLDLSTGRTQKLASGDSPDWSPDGSRIAYATSGSSGYGVVVVDADGSSQHQILTSQRRVTQLSWSPDGSRIAYASFSEGWDEPRLVIVRADGRQPRVLVQGGSDPDWRPTPPRD